MLQRCGSLFPSFSCVDSELRAGRGEARGTPGLSVWSAGRSKTKRCSGSLGQRGGSVWGPTHRTGSEMSGRVKRCRLAGLRVSA